MESDKITHLGIRIEKSVVDALKENQPDHFTTTSDLVRNILKSWLKKNKKKSV